VAEGVAGGQLPPQNPRISAAALVGAIGEVLVGPLAEARQSESVIPELVEFALRALGFHDLRDAARAPGAAQTPDDRRPASPE
jgi:hypothetical protein